MRLFQVLFGSGLLLFSTSGFANGVKTAEYAKTFPSTSVNLLTLSVVQGNVKLMTPSRENAKLTTVAYKSKDISACKVDVELQGNSLLATFEHANQNVFCKVDVEVTLPHAIQVNVQVGRGDIISYGNFGDVNFDVASGNVDLAGSASKVFGRVANGNVSVNYCGTYLDLFAAKGDIVLSCPSVKDQTKIVSRTGYGDINVKLPSTTKVNSNLKVGFGKIENDYSNSDSFDVSVDMKVGYGDLSIRKF